MMFLILTQASHEQSQCSKFANTQNGTLNPLHKNPIFQHIPAKNSVFIGREA